MKLLRIFIVLFALFAFPQAEAACTVQSGQNYICSTSSEAYIQALSITCPENPSYGLAAGQPHQTIHRADINQFQKKCFMYLGSGWPDAGGATYTNNDCGTRNVGLAAKLTFGKDWPTCVAGCKFQLSNAEQTATQYYDPNTASMVTAKLWTGEPFYNGDICTKSLPSNKPTSVEEQAPAESGGSGQETCVSQGTLTQCLKPNGQLCATASNGTQVCWYPGQVPPSVNAPDGQSSLTVSPTVTPPQAPNGQVATGANTSTSIPTSGVSSTVSVTNSSVNATTGVTNNPANNNGSTGTTTTPNASSGGANCAAPPVSSGDQILAQIATQIWLSRCSGDANANGQPDWTETTDGGISTDGDPTGAVSTETQLSFAGIDSGGILSNRTCPQLGTVDLGIFGTYSLDGYSWTCDFLVVVRALFIAMGAFTAIKILLGQNDA